MVHHHIPFRRLLQAMSARPDPLGSPLLFGAARALLPRQLGHPPICATTIAGPSTSAAVSRTTLRLWMIMMLYMYISTYNLYVKISHNMSTTGISVWHPMATRCHKYLFQPFPASFVNIPAALGPELLREAQLAGRTASLVTPDRLRHGAARHWLF